MAEMTQEIHKGEDQATTEDAVVQPPPVAAAKHARIGYLKPVAAYFALLFGPGELKTGGVRTLAIFAGMVSGIAMIFRLLVPGPVGMGDQGDGHRLVCMLGVVNVRPWNYGDFTGFISPSWVPHEYFGEGCGANGSGEPYYSSQLLLLWLGKLLTPVLGWGPGLDTRAAGIVCCIVFGLLISALIAVLPGRPGFRVLIAGLVAVVMADGIFVDFFVSPYSEAGAFVGTLAVSVALLHYWNGKGPRWLSVFLVVLATAFTISAKTQTVSWLPVLALALLWLPPRAARHIPASGPGDAKPRRGWREYVLPTTAVLAIAAFSLSFLGAQPKRFNELNLYNAVFVELLPHSPSPEKDLEWLGLDPGFISASGTTVASTRAAVYNPRYHQFTENISLGKIAGFYAAHPERLIGMGERGISAMLTPELGYLGSYLEGTGHDSFQKERRFPAVLGLFTAMKAVPVVLVALHLLTLFLGLAVAARKESGVGRLAVIMVLGCWLQFWAVMLTEGASEIYKHMIIAGFMSALCVPLLVALVSMLASNPTRSARRKSVNPAVVA